MSEQKLTEEWNNYLVVLREDAHLLLAWSYADMLGCIQAHDAQYWLKLLVNAFDGDVASGRNRLKVIGQLQEFRVIAELPDEASSAHRRDNGSLIRLLHIFLCCTAVSSR
jgi:hypothetical protein